MIGRVHIMPSQSKTKAYILQDDQGLRAACSFCCAPITSAGYEEKSHSSQWQCDLCKRFFSDNEQMSFNSIVFTWERMSGKETTVAEWIRVWTELEVEVSIDG